VVIRAFGVLAGIIDRAVKDRRLPLNVARGVNLPRKGKKPRSYLTHDQVQNLAHEAGSHRPLVLTLAYTGIRWDEAVGLRANSLDLVRRRVPVRENAVNVAGKIIPGTPKSHESRSVSFADFLTELLLKQCEGKATDALGFSDGVTHLPTPTHGDGWFAGARNRAHEADPSFPLALTLHDLRHTAANLAISARANVKAVQRMLGHASAALTLHTYADLFDDGLDDTIAVALDEARQASVAARITLVDS
tara:strand:- start:439 stop:1182 length:744 start_codon:yes stop_codon:yes gene_type:complete